MFHLHPDIHVRLRDLDRIGHLAVLLEQVPGVVILFHRLAFHRLVLQMIYANLKASLNLSLQRFCLCQYRDLLTKAKILLKPTVVPAEQ